ncbi:MAG: 16S rRNA (cytidine(1402)-2'-O)-methyltransferase [Gemmatimonadaceae bacterium]|nr:16S rRNA (cytidine(1402)-2'-O)-methyltransferase [Acetobacteraceae bacterium]
MPDPIDDETCREPPPGEDLPDQAPGRSPSIPSGLVLVATPIGNLGDLSIRAIETLRAADLVLCEDTRTTARLLMHHGIAARTSPLHDHNEDGRIPGLLDQLRAGGRIALVSDAGTPLMSDPGFRLVRAALSAGLPVGAVPGPNAAVMALILSGLPPAPFLFLGFPPPRSAARLTAFGKLRAAERAGLSATLLWHEAPHRLAETLVDLAAQFGDRPAAVARELTKRFEEVRRGSLPELAEHYATAVARGEITLVVGPAADDGADAADLDSQLRRALSGNSLKDAAALVATATGLPRKTVYARALAIDGEK